MKTQILITIVTMISLNIYSQCFVNKVFENQNLNPSNYDILSSVLDPVGNIITSANNLVGGNTKINIRCANAIGNTVWMLNCPSSITQNNYGTDIKTDALGNSYVCGANHNGSNYDYIISKFSSTGSLIWQKIYNGTGNNDDIPVALELDNSGNVYVTGSSYGIGLYNSDYVTIKYDNNGNLIWMKRYDFASLPEIVSDLVIDNVGNVFITGTSATAINNSDITTLKYSPTGVLLNTHRHNYTGNGFNIASEMILDNTNSIIITGSFENGIKKMGTLKLSNSLVQNWFYSISGSNTSEGYSIYSDNSNNIISVGYQNNNFGGSNIFINKLSSTGTIIWDKIFQNPNPSNFAKARKVKGDIVGNIYIASDAVQNSTKDFLTLALDASGNTIWEKYYNSPNNANDIPYSLHVKNNNVIVSGISTLGSSKTISTVKYNVDTKPLIASLSPAGNYNKNELLIWFDSSHVIKQAIDKKEFQTGKLADFIKPDFLKILEGKMKLTWGELKTFKVYTRMTTADSITLTRQNAYVKIPTFWATLSVMLPSTTSEQQVIDSLNTLVYDIKEVDYNYFYDKTSIPNDFYITTNQAGIYPTSTYPNANIGVNQAWDYEVGKPYTKVGVFDDVIYWGHEDFGNGTLSGSKIAGGYDYYNSTSIANTTSPLASHGTACAGIIGALRNNNLGISGIAGGDAALGNTGATLYSMAIFKGATSTTSAIIRNAIVEGASNTSTFGFGLHVQSHSWGGPSDGFKSAVEYAAFNGCALVVSKGNSGHTGNPLLYPSCSKDDYVIAVGASGVDGKHKNQNNGDFTFSSNWESSFDNNVDIIAPGVTELVSSSMNPAAPFNYPTSLPNTNYNVFNGTSAAAPNVAGVAALMISKHNNGGSTSTSTKPENLAPEDIENIMQNTATDVIDASLGYPAGYDIWNGYGKINASECLHKVNYPEYEVAHYASSQGITTTTTSNLYINVPSSITSLGIAAGSYIMDRITIDAITYVSKQPTQQLVGWWLTNNLCYGTDASNPLSLDTHYQEFTTNPVSLGTSAVSAGMRTYCYLIKYDLAGNAINKWYPCQPHQVNFRYSVHLNDLSFVGINETSKTNEINIYPNPTNDVFYIQVGNEYKLTKDDRYEFYSIDGKLLLSDKIISNVTPLNIYNFSSGIYIVKSFINNKVNTFKILKH